MGAGISAIDEETIEQIIKEKDEDQIKQLSQIDQKAFERLKAKYGSIYRVPGIYDKWKQSLTK